MFDNKNDETQKIYAISDCNLNGLINSKDENLNIKIKENGSNLHLGKNKE